MTYTRERLGELLVSSGLLSDEELAKVLEDQNKFGGKLGEILVNQLILSEEQIAGALAKQKGLEHVNLTSITIDRGAASLVSERIARLREVIPISVTDDELVLAMSDPLDIETIDDVEVRTGRRVTPVVSSRSQIIYAIDKYLASSDAFSDVVTAAEDTLSEEEIAAGEDVPVVRLVNSLIREAVREGASDIHIEPSAKTVNVRYRVDGVMNEIMELPIAARAGITSRIKIMSEMDIAERRRPQDGRIALRVESMPVDIRVASLPTPFGEGLTLRILNAELTFRSLTDLGMNAEHLKALDAMVAKPYGAVLVAGPTGSGKSTTLYATLQKLNLPTRKIITVEDPIEYQMSGITQMAVNARIGLTFASGLRTILRSDPDIVMVGEIRDPETAEIAVRAALTGHVVLSSIHTNDAPGTLTRLTDMGVPPYITSSGLLGVIAQRLVRRLCDDCKEVVKVSGPALVAAGFSAAEAKKVKVHGPVGCARCGNAGYRGRVGIFEIMPMNEDLTRAYLEEAPTERMRELALEAGMVPLREDALAKVAAGTTSLQEIDRVVI
ncbi:MAG: ATPase, T2SS/T4P/T4SS family [Actinomycetota bacterium]|nr:ATPase, T2SS/T4P/T4SS family [Actinomycetota bacterium]